MPIGAVMISEAIYDALVKQSEKIGVFSHGFTYSGHPVTSAVALETLKIYEKDDILSHVRRVAPRMQAGLRQFADHPLVGEVRGIGLIGAVELVADKATKRRSIPPKPSVRFSSSALITMASSCVHWATPSRSVLRSSSTKQEIDLMFETVRTGARRYVRDGSGTRLIENGLVPALAK